MQNYVTLRWVWYLEGQWWPEIMGIDVSQQERSISSLHILYFESFITFLIHIRFWWNLYRWKAENKSFPTVHISSQTDTYEETHGAMQLEALHTLQTYRKVVFTGHLFGSLRVPYESFQLDLSITFLIRIRLADSENFPTVPIVFRKMAAPLRCAVHVQAILMIPIHVSETQTGLMLATNNKRMS